MKLVKLNMNCLYCEEENPDLPLLSGKAIHKSCLNELENLDVSAKEFVTELEKVIEIRESELNRLNSRLIYRFFPIFFDKTEIKRKADVLVELHSALKDKKKELVVKTIIKNASLKPIYDYWLSRPPDWTERSKEFLESLLFCEQCYLESSGLNPLHAHHKLPISKGGDHTEENLMAICKVCHIRTHNHTFSDSNKFERRKLGHFEKRTQLIHYAVLNKKEIDFSYINYNKVKSRRTIRPVRFLRMGNSLCIRGYCYKRKEDRTFAIKRISELSINKS